MIKYTDPSREHPEKAKYFQKVALPVRFNCGPLSENEKCRFGIYGVNLAEKGEDGPQPEDSLPELLKKDGYYGSDDGYYEIDLSACKDTTVGGFRAIERVDYIYLNNLKKDVPCHYNFDIDITSLFNYGNKKGRNGPVIIFNVEFKSYYGNAEKDVERINHFEKTIESFKQNFTVDVHKPILIYTLDYWLDGSGFSPGAQVINKEDSSVDKNAEKEKGEDKGIRIPAAVFGTVTAIGSAVAAGLAIAGHSGSVSNENKEKHDDSGTYRMYFSKDFGNRIKKGGRAREVRARIEKTTSEGDIHRRDDLSYNISFKGSTYIHTGEKYNSDGSAAVQIWADKNVPKDIKEDFISVICSGEGGNFTERIHFDLVGDPFITFPEMDPHALAMNVDVIGEDNLTYNVMFTLEDIEEQPENITFSSENPGLDIKYEWIEDYTYDAVIENHTSENNTRVYEIEERSYVEITAVFADGTEAKNGFYVSIYPEGLSVKAKNKDGIIQINSVENKNHSELDYAIKPTAFKPVLAVTEELDDGTKKAVIIEADKTEIEFEDLKTTSDITKVLLEKYDYEINTEHLSSEGCVFLPKKSIPSYYPPEDWEKRKPEDYEISILMKAKYKNETFNMDIPCLLIGEKLDPMGTWKEQYHRVIRAITRYVPSELQDQYFNKLSRMMKSHSTRELRVIEKIVFSRAVTYYTDENKKAMNFEYIMGWCVDISELAKNLGDVAFSIAVVDGLKKAGLPDNKAVVAEIFISCAKDITVSAIGEKLEEYYYGIPFNIEDIGIFDSIAKIGENIICKELDVAIYMNPLEMRKAVYVLAGYSVYTAFKNYLDTVNNGEPDFLGSLLKTVFDFSETTITALAMGTLGQYVSSQAFQKKLTEIFKNYLGEKFVKSFTVKYLTAYSKADGFKNQAIGQELYEHCMDANGKVIMSKWFEWSKTAKLRSAITDMVNSDVFQKYVETVFGIGVAKVKNLANSGAEVLAGGVREAQNAVKEVYDSVSNTNLKFEYDNNEEHIMINIPFSESYEFEIDLTTFFNNAKDNITEAVRFIYNTFWSFVPFVEKPVKLPEYIPVKMNPDEQK